MFTNRTELCYYDFYYNPSIHSYTFMCKISTPSLNSMFYVSGQGKYHS